MRAFQLTPLLLTLTVNSAFSQTAATVAGAGAGAALGGATPAGATTPSSMNSAPIEMQIMAFQGLDRIAQDIALVTKAKLCPSSAGVPPTSCAPAVLLEDSTSLTQIGLANTLVSYADTLDQLHTSLQNQFALLVAPATVELSPANRSGSVTLRNNSSYDLKIIQIRITDKANNFAIDQGRGSCVLKPSGVEGAFATQVPANNVCTVAFSFKATAPDEKFSASLEITPDLAALQPGVPGIGDISANKQVVQLTATTPKPKPAETPKPKKPNPRTPSALDLKDEMDILRNRLDRIAPQTELNDGGSAAIVGQGGELNPAIVGATGNAGGGSGNTLTTTSAIPSPTDYLNGVSTALNAIKSGIAYTPTPFQPTTQAFQVLLEKELSDKGVSSYTSTSPLNLQSAADILAGSFATMLAESADVSNWTAYCKAVSGGAAKPVPGFPPPSAPNPVCFQAQVIANLQAAAQIVTAYTTMFQTTTDSVGNPTMVDTLRGMVLNQLIGDRIPSLQVSVAAAGGSTRTNSFFLMNLFYTPKPSYNSGVVATFELRDGGNLLLSSGMRSVLFDYKKWKPRSFDPNKLEIHSGDAYNPTPECAICNEQ